MISNYLNLNSYFEYELFDQQTKGPASVDELKKVLPPSIVELELLKDKDVPIPQEVLAQYSTFRHTPLYRVENFEKKIGTDCRIFIKNEGASPSGNHKMNSAYLIAHMCRKDGIKTMTTETTGNWGIALAIAAQRTGLELLCFMDGESHKKRPDRKAVMEGFGAKVIVVEYKDYCNDLLALSANAAIDYTLQMDNTAYIFGSIYGYFTIPQTIIGLEAKVQLAELGVYPDLVVGSCGGGANLIGTAGAFLADKIEGKQNPHIISAESEHCPILTKGQWGLYSIDDRQYYPLIKTYGLKGLSDSEYIGGLGSTIVSSAVANFHDRGLIEARVYNSSQAYESARTFHEAENKWVALETGYQLAAVIDYARNNSGKDILVNISAGEKDNHLFQN